MKITYITYWVSTVIISAFFLMNVYMYFSRDLKIVSGIEALGYPLYILDILGIAKILGIIALYIPKVPRLKEWAYAGFTIDLLGAIWSHNAVGDTSANLFIFLCLLFLATSYISMRILQISKDQQ